VPVDFNALHDRREQLARRVTEMEEVEERLTDERDGAEAKSARDSNQYVVSTFKADRQRLIDEANKTRDERDALRRFIAYYRDNIQVIPREQRPGTVTLDGWRWWCDPA
jgi:acetyl-CoA carboxylase carboxyltransferase component|tara:strand:- start:5678 stop:6004 length:327 start_codon:yes stop_codon:yes gene_type:complete